MSLGDFGLIKYSRFLWAPGDRIRMQACLSMADFLASYAKVEEMGGGDEHGYFWGDDVSGWVAGYISERTIEKLYVEGFNQVGYQMRSSCEWVPEHGLRIKAQGRDCKDI